MKGEEHHNMERARNDSRMYGRGLGHLLTVQIEEDYNTEAIVSEGRMGPERSTVPL